MKKRKGAPISKKAFEQSGRPSEMVDTLVRFWEGLRVVDADFDLVIHLEEVDYKHAKARNIFECAFVQAAGRLYGATHAIFTKTVAYVDLMMDGKERKVYRFHLSQSARRTIEAFDRTKTAQERAALAEQAGSNFVLRAPPFAKSLEGRRADEKKRRRRRRILVKGSAVCVKKKKRTASKLGNSLKAPDIRQKYGRSVLELSDIRNAKGLVHFQVGMVVPSVMPGSAEPTKK